MIKTIIFDLGGVYFTNGSKNAIEEISKKYNIKKEKVADVLSGELGTEYRLGNLTADDFWDKAKSFWNLKEDKKILEEIWLNGYIPIEGTVELVKKLKENNYEILFLSDNVQERVNYLEKKYQFQQNFKDGVFSHIVKVRKPNIKIYLLVLEKTNSKPEECVFIDDKEKLLEPAKSLGMDGIEFKDADQVTVELEKLGVKL